MLSLSTPVAALAKADGKAAGSCAKVTLACLVGLGARLIWQQQTNASTKGISARIERLQIVLHEMERSRASLRAYKVIIGFDVYEQSVCSS
jgi:hypothetical protein